MSAERTGRFHERSDFSSPGRGGRGFFFFFGVGSSLAHDTIIPAIASPIPIRRIEAFMTTIT